MTHNQRLGELLRLGWIHDETSGRHQVCAERCDYISGTIGTVEWAAWIGVDSGMVYLQGQPAVAGDYDFTFDAFCTLVRDGWPVVKVAPAARGLFDGED